jgi:hypothetical protein
MDEQEIPEYSAGQLEVIAFGVHKQFKCLCTQGHVDIDFVAEECYGLEIVTMYLPTLWTSGLGNGRSR